MKLNTICTLIGAKTDDVPDVVINWLLTDSRSLSFPAGSLFFAIETKRNDGHRYIVELYNQNLRYFVVSKILPEFNALADAVFLQVEDVMEALQHLAAVHRAFFHIPVVGITGSNGKTIVKEWLYQLLHGDYNITRSPRSYNSQIGVPLSVWGLNEGTELGIFEAGISETGEMERLQKILNPTIGIFTNLGDAHQENFVSLKQKAQEKLKLFANSETLIYNKDNKLLDIAIVQAGIQAGLFSWGSDKDAVVHVLSVDKTNDNTQISLRYKQSEFKATIPFTDDASLENAMHCIVLMLYMGIGTEEIAWRVSRLETVAMRMEVKEGIRGCLIINDSYNSDINSLSIALDFMTQQATVKNLSRTLILSDIMQSGLTSAELYRRVADLVKSKNISRLVGIGSEITKYADKFEGLDTRFYLSTEEFLKSSLFGQFQNELILLKGSRVFHFEDISARLELIAHETVLEVNLNALVDNLNYFRSKLRPETKIMSMVKAFAYGSGSVEVARTLQHHHCDYLAVAVADEGVELRREGIRIPIVVMNPEQGSFGLIFDNKLEPEIYSFRLLESFIAYAEKAGITDYPVHIKIDSGMHRLGFAPEDIDTLIERLKSQTQLKVRSVFSHLAGADEARFDDFTRRQAEVFISCADRISNAFPQYIMRHILNSSGIERFSEYQFDMVRLGIGHYGVSALPGSGLKQVCSLKTIILQIKEIKAGETVGYSRKGVVKKDSRIAILPIGYADGFDRRLGNGVGEVFINGKRAKLIGNICMDLSMVDISGIDAQEGDNVEIFGDNITVSEVASWMKTIPYEVLTGVSRRVKRVYFQE
ncbi:bifunctional UDP-N-acetylmuramoyl-tripeptide:D-alanyl-D-alanine ligase/alanine racemase [Paludibacter sp. 221]|uniref:bifunctional UDP-N-acetylmuramoyl-tripeptide:D-alanyl-D-alanine ligase/alanine racemase n=1 Tax=Paludibacter sp. 221 TaxID=2302939 RepID=UPI0013D6204D|nr:bifunctional UDP-N-acetylmuramoyl-tripeptide:D-alanyl-D-alanine ligase/alanine racemase [Paludibacter sp. 221]NDV46768.1 bifunctional UDP-N-acetylmuramoyl-tripeptide:D-alanyl-D-alanine ligase/alanine racemase [Paludibacter sp. 221]